MSKEDLKNINLSKNDKIKHNIYIILLYSLSTAIALGLNDLIISIFNNFNHKNNIIAKSIYVLLIFIITIIFAYYVHSNIII